MNQSGPSFAMLCCACGAEKVVKAAMAEDGWRLAFSRPGFVTAKHDDAVAPPQGIFVRTSASSIGQCRNESAAQQLQSLVQALDESPFADRKFDQLHVWPKDRAPIGRFGFEPGIDEVSRVVADSVFDHLPKKWLRCEAPNRIAEIDDVVLDVVLVEPAHWFIGWHKAKHWPERWPGGVQPIQPKHEPISRAYYKAAEAIVWSGFDLKEGDLAVDIGSAPGGATGRLLELGQQVIGIDPAEMDERIAGHPKLRHIRARAGDLPRKDFAGAKWMLVDSNVTPDKTLTTVKNIIQNRHSDFRGLLLTMKLGDYDKAVHIDRWVRSILQWGVDEVRVRQLARNKCEVCFAVTV